MKAVSNESFNIKKSNSNYTNYDNFTSTKSPPSGMNNFSVVSLKSAQNPNSPPIINTPNFPWQQLTSNLSPTNEVKNGILNTSVNPNISSNNKQIIRHQPVMVGNKVVQNFNHHRTVQSPDPVQYVVKKSQNQTIVILTKPSTSNNATCSNISNNQDLYNQNRSIHVTETSNSNPSNMLAPNTSLTSSENNSRIKGNIFNLTYPGANSNTTKSNQNSNKVVKATTISSHLNNQNLIKQQAQYHQNSTNGRNNTTGASNGNSLIKPITLIPVNNINTETNIIYKFNDIMNNNGIALNDSNNNNNKIQNYN
jgi:hypothetical protein